ncbi:MAG: hypothetical protein K2O18_13705 [Oscillospiraceae bacterium]|nr:hypothetical protein [Oscillospiraceae bacterium]
MSDATVNTAAAAQAAAQQAAGSQSKEVRRISSPRMDVLDIENIAGINLNMVRLAHQNRPVVQLTATRAAVSQSYREETVIDFAQGTVSQYVNEDLPVMRKNAFQRDDAAVRITFSAADYQAGQLEEVIREMIADHQERRSALEEYFSNDEQLDEILEELDELYQEGEDAAAASFANMVDYFWECRGQGSLEQRETVRSSVEALFVSFASNQETQDETLMTLEELDSTAVSISTTLRSANLPGGRAQGVMQYRAAAAMQNIEISRSLGQG